jgi:DNA modification methylase
MDCLEGCKQLDSETVDLIVTDPPYEVEYDKKSTHLSKIGKARRHQIERDSHFIDKMVDYNLLASEMFRILKKDSHCYIFCGTRQLVTWISCMTAAGFKHPQLLIWYKKTTTFDSTYGHQYQENKENLLFFQKGWRKLEGYKVERHEFRSVLRFDASLSNKYHPCEKPIRLISFLTKASSNSGDLCLDLFAGSGNHLIAFKREGRRFLGFETSRAYYDIVQSRLRAESEQKRLI